MAACCASPPASVSSARPHFNPPVTLTPTLTLTLILTTILTL